MKGFIRILAVAMAAILAVALWPAWGLTASGGTPALPLPTLPLRTIPPILRFACSIDNALYLSLDEALAAVLPGQTITLLRDIDYSSSLVIDGITLDLNGHTLNINVTEGTATSDALLVTNNAWLIIHDTTTWEIDSAINVTYNVTSNPNGYAAVRATNHGLVEVSSITATGAGVIGARSEGSGSSLEVFGSVGVAGDGSVGVLALVGSCINVRYGGITVRGERGLGAGAERATQLQVDGNVTVYGDNGFGVGCGGCELNVGGSILVDGINGLGVQVDGRYQPRAYNDPGLVTVIGYVRANNFARVQGVWKTAADKDIPSAHTGWDTYTVTNPLNGTTGQLQVKQK